MTTPSQPVAERLDEIEARLSSATPGPWERNWPDGKGSDGWIIANNDRDFPIVVEPRTGVNRQPDADLIANAPADLRWLIEDNKRLREALVGVHIRYTDFDDEGNGQRCWCVTPPWGKHTRGCLAARAALRGEQ